MSKTKSATMIEIAEDWMLENQVREIDIERAAEWAVETGRYQLPPISPERQCRQDMLHALQRQKYTDPQGRNVRTHHAVKLNYLGEQLSLFVDARITRPAIMEQVFQQNFGRIINDVKRHSIEKASYDENNLYGAQLSLFDYNFNEYAKEAILTGQYDDSDDGDDSDEE